jgi:hypothetical protein
MPSGNPGAEDKPCFVHMRDVTLVLCIRKSTLSTRYVDTIQSDCLDICDYLYVYPRLIATSQDKRFSRIGPENHKLNGQEQSILKTLVWLYGALISLHQLGNLVTDAKTDSSF